MLLTLVIVSLLIPATGLLIHQFVRRSLDVPVDPQTEPAHETRHELARAA